jgi:hypothetical protein
VNGLPGLLVVAHVLRLDSLTTQDE